MYGKEEPLSLSALKVKRTSLKLALFMKKISPSLA